MYSKFLLLAFLLFLCGLHLLTHVNLDVSKITCDQYVHHKIGNPRIVAAWLLAIDLQNVEAMADKVHSYCEIETNWK